MKRNLINLLGDLPKHTKPGLNNGRIDRKATAAKYNLTVKLLFKAYLNWQHIFRFKNSSLTFRQYLDKLVQAGLTPTDIGNKKNQYNLSRYGDIGAYANQNCRFISRKENESEQFKPPATILNFVCKECQVPYQRQKGYENKGLFCSVRCAGIYNVRLRRNGRVPIQ